MLLSNLNGGKIKIKIPICKHEEYIICSRRLIYYVYVNQISCRELNLPLFGCIYRTLNVALIFKESRWHAESRNASILQHITQLFAKLFLPFWIKTISSESQMEQQHRKMVPTNCPVAKVCTWNVIMGHWRPRVWTCTYIYPHSRLAGDSSAIMADLVLNF